MLDLRLAVRSLLKTPLVTAVAVLSLALGIGANAAIFAIFERVILRPLPVREPGRLVYLSAEGPKPGSQSTNNAGGMASVFSYPMFRDLEAADTGLSGLAGHRALKVNLAFDGSTVSGQGMLVSGGYFETLGVLPALGRLFDREDDTTPGAHPLVVLAHHYWQNRFDSAASVLNRTLIVNGQPMTIVGVAPRGFEGTTLGSRPEVFVPLSMRERLVPNWEGFGDRRSYWVYVFARLPDGISVDQAQASVNVPYRAILNDVDVPLQTGLTEQTMERFKNKHIALEPGYRGQSNMHEDTETPLLMLLAVTGFVLLIACANVANLLLTRGADRAGEIAVRLSIGARRYQLIRQLLTESSVLALLGGLLGFAVAHATLRVVSSMLPADAVGTHFIELGPTTWLFLAAMASITSLVGLFPALNATRNGLVTSLRNPSGYGSRSRSASRFRMAMVTLQIALSMTLLISAGLFTRSLVNVSRVDLGIDSESLATFAISPDLSGYSGSESRALFERLEDELRAIPGVTQVSAGLVPLIAGSNWGNNVSVQGFADGPDVDSNSNYDEIGPDYFRTLGVALISGREFERRDALGAPGVAIVNESFARKFQLGRDAVGSFMAIGATDELDLVIVGLVADAKYSEVKGAVPPVFFVPYRQREERGDLNFFVRAAGAPEPLLPLLRDAVARLDRDLPLENLKTMELQIRENLLLDRLLTILSAAFASLATLLAAVGLYGVVAYAVAQRTRELGLRMALGADAGRVRRLIQRQVALMVFPGAAVGVLAALTIGSVASSLLYEMEGHDPSVFAAGVIALVLVAFAAGALPAMRASRIDPMVALREE